MTKQEQIEAQMAQFVAERNAAILTMDKEVISQYMLKWGIQPPVDDDVFWASVHMARSGAKDLPMHERLLSRRWLTERGLRSMDEGEVK